MFIRVGFLFVMVCSSVGCNLLGFFMNFLWFFNVFMILL